MKPWSVEVRPDEKGTVDVVQKATGKARGVRNRGSATKYRKQKRH